MSKQLGPSHPIDARDLEAQLSIITPSQSTRDGHRQCKTSKTHQRPTSPSAEDFLAHAPRGRQSSRMGITTSRGTRKDSPSPPPQTAAAAAHSNYTRSATYQHHHREASISPKPPTRRSTASSAQSKASTSTSKSTSSSTRAQKEFHYYGRHTNQWLFNDFSVTDALARRARRVKDAFGGEKERRDWFEDRGR